MGTVWLATRSDGRYEGHAAVKLLNLAFLSAARRERFRREGSVLVSLDHPGIARLLDAGVNAAGQPDWAARISKARATNPLCFGGTMDGGGPHASCS
jgi:serine/threonine protein kinase